MKKIFSLILIIFALCAFAQTAKGSGGPDSFGYTWKDSDETGGPVFNWNDISGVGAMLNLGDEGVSTAVNIGFTFNFYGNNYNSLYICSNGFLSFSSQAIGPHLYQNTALPNANQPNNLLAVFWDDLDMSNMGNVYYHYDSVLKKFTVQFENVPLYGEESIGGNTFQVILYNDNRIEYLYKELEGTISMSTVGIENSAGNIATQLSYNSSAYLKNNLAVEFCPPSTKWLCINPKRGTVSGDSQLSVTADFNASGLSAGRYYSSIDIYSTDPDTPVLTIPVKFNVYELTAPQNPAISVSGGNVTLTWTAVPYASGYKVYSGANPYGTLTEDTSGSFTGPTTWTTAAGNQKAFYKITAVDAK